MKMILLLFFNIINALFIANINKISSNQDTVISGDFSTINGVIDFFNDINIVNKNIIFKNNFIINANAIIKLENILESTENLNGFLVLNEYNEIQKFSNDTELNKYNTINLNSINSLDKFDLTFNTTNENSIIINNVGGNLLCNSPIHIEELANSIIDKDITINNSVNFENIICQNYESNNSQTTINGPLEINANNQYSCNSIKGLTIATKNLPNIVCQGTINFGTHDITVNNSTINLFLNSSLEQNIQNFLALDSENRLCNTPIYPLSIKTEIVNSNDILHINNINNITAKTINMQTGILNINPLNSVNLIIEDVISHNASLYLSNIIINNKALFSELGRTSVTMTNNNDPNIKISGVINDTLLPINIFLGTLSNSQYLTGTFNIYFPATNTIINNIQANSVYSNYLVSQIPDADTFAFITIENINKNNNIKEQIGLDLLRLYKNIKTVKENINKEFSICKTLNNKYEKLIITEKNIDTNINIIKTNYNNNIESENIELYKAIELLLLEYRELEL